MSKDPYKRRVKEVASTDVVSVDAIDTVHAALVLMAENRVSALPVINARRECVGIISATDLIDVTRELEDELTDLGRVSEVSHQWFIDKLTEHDMERQRVDEIMTEQVTSVGPETLLVDAAREMLKHHVHRLPVLDEHQRLVGILSMTDVLTVFVDGAPG